MEPGSVVDEGHGHFELLRWTGAVLTRAWYGGVRVRRKQLLPVQAYRCPKCGRLELYVAPA